MLTNYGSINTNFVELRFTFFVSLLALSVKCTLKVQKHVLKVVSFKPDLTLVYLSPDNRNINMCCEESGEWHWYANDMEVSGLVDMENKFPWTNVYCKSISDVAKIYVLCYGWIAWEISPTCTIQRQMNQSKIPYHLRFEKEEPCKSYYF